MKHTPAHYSTAGIIAERDQLRAVNSELLATLRKALTVLNHTDTPCSPELREEVRETIAKAEVTK